MKLSAAPTRRILKKTWAEKVTDDTNYWLQARNLEKDGLLEDAIRQYIKDAHAQSDKNVLRSALSISCSGRCYLKLGMVNKAHAQFKRAASLYESVLPSVHDKENREWLSKRISHCRKMAATAQREVDGGRL